MTDKSMAMELVQNLPETISLREIRDFFDRLDDIGQGKLTPEELASISKEEVATFKADLIRQLKENPPPPFPPPHSAN